MSRFLLFSDSMPLCACCDDVWTRLVCTQPAPMGASGQICPIALAVSRHLLELVCFAFTTRNEMACVSALGAPSCEAIPGSASWPMFALKDGHNRLCAVSSAGAGDQDRSGEAGRVRSGQACGRLQDRVKGPSEACGTGPPLFVSRDTCTLT